MEIIVVVALGAIIAGFVQGVSGFAFGMVSMSIWVWVLDPHVAAALVVFGALTGQIMAAFTVKRGFHFRMLWPYLAGGLLGVPIGVTLLPMMDVNWFKFFLGMFLVIWCPTMLFLKNLPRLSPNHRVLNGIVGILGGAMGGIGGFAGVLPSLWCTLCTYDKDVQRSIIQNFSLTMLSVTMITYIATNLVAPETLPLFAVVLPAMLVPTWLGMRVYTRINPVAFRRLILALLTLSGISMLISSIPKLI